MSRLKNGEAPTSFWWKPRVWCVTGIEHFPIQLGDALSLPAIGSSGIDEFLSRVVCRIEPRFDGHRRLARPVVEFKCGSSRLISANDRNRQSRRQEFGFIFIPNLHDVLHSYAIDQVEDVRPRRQNVSGDCHRHAERDDGLFVPLVRSGTRDGYGAEQHRTKRKYNSSHTFHDTSLLVG